MQTEPMNNGTWVRSSDGIWMDPPKRQQQSYRECGKNTWHSGGVPSAESRLDISSCVLGEEVDRATDCICEGWGEGVVVWERWLVARIFLA
jgi:hypothetical protein